MPGHEGRDEPVAVQRHGEGEAAERRSQRCESSATRDDPAASASPSREQQATAKPHRETHADPDRPARARPRPRGSGRTPWTPSWLAATTRVKATIGVTIPSLSPLSTLRARRRRIGILLVVDHLRAQSGVGGRQRRRDEAHHGQRKVGEAPRRDDRAQHERERQAQPEQTCRDADVLAQSHHIDPGRVREEEERKRDLRQDVHRWRVDVDGEGTPVRVRQQVAGDREEQGTSDVGPDQEPRHHGPAQDQERDGSERGLRHLLFLRPQGSVGSGDSAAASRRRLRRTVKNTIVIATVVTSPEMTNDASGKSPSA